MFAIVHHAGVLQRRHIQKSTSVETTAFTLDVDKETNNTLTEYTLINTAFDVITPSVVSFGDCATVWNY